MKQLLLNILIFSGLMATAQAGNVYYVNADQPDNSGDGTTWQTAKKELQSAISLAGSGEQVWVKAGTYKPTGPGGNRNISFSMKNGVEIYGGFLGTETIVSQRNEIYNITILSGDLNGDDGADFANNGENSYHVVKNVNVNNTGVLDGFTITGGNSNEDGAGMYNAPSSPTIRNVNFVSNNALNTGGAIYNLDSKPTKLLVLSNCVFYKNRAGVGSAIFDMPYVSLLISNCIFDDNTGEGVVYAAGILSGETITILNSTITSNHQRSGITYDFLSLIVQNSIFHSNDLSDDYVTNDIILSERGSLSFSYSLRTGEYAGKGLLNGQFDPPLFVNASDPDGPDNIWRTADDGLRLLCGSPAINTGKNDSCDGTLSNTDILGLPRTGNYSMGAYEGGVQLGSVNSLSSINSKILGSQNETGTTNYATCSGLVASLNSGGSYNVAGSVSAKVWIESSQPAEYLKRHYEIAPAVNSTTATGKVTLYFTQQDFNDFNAVNETKLPLNSTDAESYKANLRIEKRAGTSSDETGLPNTYSTATSPVTFAPTDANGSVTWNASASRWEVDFEVTGFSGFFVKTAETPLPLRLMGFTGTQETEVNKLNWQTANEINTKSFELESSRDAKNFLKIATINAVSRGDNSYGYNDKSIYQGIVYYRLKMIDIDGTFSYSRILWLNGSVNGLITIYPNPVDAQINLNLDEALLDSHAMMYDAGGRLVQKFRIIASRQQVNVKPLASGVYIIKFSNGSVERFVKQ